MKTYRIVKAQERYCESHTQTINGVSREGEYLSTNSGFSYESIVSFFRYCETQGFPQFFVVDENDQAVGWCDIVRRDGKPHSCGYIGIGLRPEYREQGIGRELMCIAMDAAKDCGFKEIRLECRDTNKRALHVYKSLGFRISGYKKRGLFLDGKVIPLVCMKKKLV